MPPARAQHMTTSLFDIAGDSRPWQRKSWRNYADADEFLTESRITRADTRPHRVAAIHTAGYHSYKVTPKPGE